MTGSHVPSTEWPCSGIVTGPDTADTIHLEAALVSACCLANDLPQSQLEWHEACLAHTTVLTNETRVHPFLFRHENTMCAFALYADNIPKSVSYTASNEPRSTTRASKWAARCRCGPSTAATGCNASI